MKELKAVIFDIDGTILDNNDYHFLAWQKYLEGMGIQMSDEDFKENISGRTNQDATEHVFGRKMTDEEAASYYLDKEKIYRGLYKKDIAPITGLIDFLQDLQQHHTIMAIATSGIQENIDFMFQHVPISQFFTAILKGDDITNGKPDPEIFTKTAKKLNVPAANCVVFEDSTSGVQAGKAAGMKVIALTTTHTKEELSEADLVINDYTQVNYDKVAALL